MLRFISEVLGVSLKTCEMETQSFKILLGGTQTKLWMYTLFLESERWHYSLAGWEGTCATVPVSCQIEDAHSSMALGQVGVLWMLPVLWWSDTLAQWDYGLWVWAAGL